MLRYIIKRLLLFIPTLILVSCLTFFLGKQVPADQVAMLLNIQGIDDSNDLWISEYDKIYKKMNLHLPEFYFSVRPNYLINTVNRNFEIYERKFVSKISSQKYSKEYVYQLQGLINQTPEVPRKKLFNSVGFSHLSAKLFAMGNELPESLKKSIIELIDKSENHKVKWHYPIISYNGFQNQYHKWIQNIFKGDLGISLLDTRPVTDKLWEALRWSLVLVTLNLVFALMLAFPIGVYNGMRPNSLFDNISNSTLFAFFAIPKFWLATLFLIFFTTEEYGTWTNIFPSVGIWYSQGAQSFTSMLASSWHKLILPILMLVIPDAAYIARLIRASVKEESNKEYIKTALSKGMSVKNITIKHILPNSLIPTISLLVSTLPGALASALIIEVIFNIPGIGRLMFISINSADWAMVYPIVLIISVVTVIIFLLGDILIAYLNPKIKFK